ncbi:hypothetical protein C4D60_Mb09t06960 [Musa balbisiana]|uniref:Uncharacterized protein n=1 Tax=Musa balbisiana TaxID=52838 RepID=A0A4S8IEQ4_MUSBA|nr:hypothetical protein C4D60_Mb09t06960 [Musa balbisiana]
MGGSISPHLTYRITMALSSTLPPPPTASCMDRCHFLPLLICLFLFPLIFFFSSPSLMHSLSYPPSLPPYSITAASSLLCYITHYLFLLLVCHYHLLPLLIFILYLCHRYLLHLLLLH